MKYTLAFLLAAIILFALPAGYAAVEETLPTLTYIGHSHLMIITANGTVIYVDPMAVSGYTYEHNADIILVSHEHSDHNQVNIVPKNDGCVILRVRDTINKDKTYNTITIGGITVIPVPAQNTNHSLRETNGFVILFDGFAVYHAADTGLLDSMGDLKQYGIDYAFFPIDGKYNMDAAEAMECAQLVGAKHNTPIHWFSADPAVFTPDGLLLMNAGDTIVLEKTDE